MAADIAKNVSKKLKSEAGEKGKKTISAGRLRKMIAKELHSRNQQAIESSYSGSTLVDTQNSEIAPKQRPGKPHIGTADKDQHNVFRADSDSVMHDRSKRLASSS